MKKLWLLLALLPFAVSADLIHGLDSSGNRWPARVNSSGQVSTTLAAGEDQTLNQVWMSLAGTGCNISTATSTECKDPGGEVVGFYVNSTSTGTIQFYNDNDGTCSSGALTGVITPAIGWHFLPLRFSTAICVLTANTINVTVVYR